MPLGNCDIAGRIQNNNSAGAHAENGRPDNKDGCDCRQPNPQ
jgi:hypothetical protein